MNGGNNGGGGGGGGGRGGVNTGRCGNLCCCCCCCCPGGPENVGLWDKRTGCCNVGGGNQALGNVEKRGINESVLETVECPDDTGAVDEANE